MRTIYVHKVGRRLFSENVFTAAVGFSEIGFNVQEHEVNSELYDLLKQNKSAVFVGGINAVRSVFSELGIPQPVIDNPHIHLPSFLGREMFELSFSDVEQYASLENSFPFFIKPLEEHKLFTGYVVKSKHDLFQAKNRVRPETKILMSEVVDFVSEHRCFVHKGKLVGCKNYTGDFKLLPDFNVVESAISQYENQPIGYSIDFGVTKEGKTLLVEMNDGFGLSAYGLNKIIYCQILLDRWDEILKNNKL